MIYVCGVVWRGVVSVVSVGWLVVASGVVKWPFSVVSVG